jgi:hypothetical protein
VTGLRNRAASPPAAGANAPDSPGPARLVRAVRALI